MVKPGAYTVSPKSMRSPHVAAASRRIHLETESPVRSGRDSTLCTDALVDRNVLSKYISHRASRVLGNAVHAIKGQVFHQVPAKPPPPARPSNHIGSIGKKLTDRVVATAQKVSQNNLHRSLTAAFTARRSYDPNVLRTTLEDIENGQRYKFVIHPLSTFKTLWDLTTVVFVLLYCWFAPVEMCFDWWTPSEAISDFMIFLDVWFILDMVLRFRTGFVDCGTIIMNPSIISKHYVKSIWFYIDAFSSFPFEFIFSNDSTASVSTRHTVKLMKYFKVPKLLRLGRLLKNLNRYKGYNGIVTVFGSLIYVSHFTACVWVLLVNPCPDGTVEPLCSNDQMLSLYLIAYQIAIASLTGGTVDVLQSTATVLGGSYKSRNPPPSLYIWSIVMQPLGAIFLALIFGNVIALVQSVNRNGNAFRKKMDQVYHEMDSLNLPKSLRQRVESYYDYLWLNNRSLSDEMTLLKDRGMSLPLRHQIAICLYKEQLIKIPFFQHATDDVLGMICMLLRQVIYMPNDYIFKEGEIGKELYMIVKGCVEVLPSENSLEGSNPNTQDTVFLGDGDFFGEIGIVMEVYRTRSVRAATMAELCILTKDGFNSILGDFPEFANEMKKLVIKRITLLYGDENMSPETLSRITDIAEHNLQKRIKAYATTRRYMQRQTELALGTRDKRNLLHRLQSPVAKATTLDIDVNDDLKESSDDDSASSESEVDDKLLAPKVWLIARQLKKLKLETAEQTKSLQDNMIALGSTLMSIQEQLKELNTKK